MKISIEKVKAILKVEDIEGLIEIHGAPEDEYDDEAEAEAEAEAEEVYAGIKTLNKNEIDEAKIIEIISDVWQKMFNLDEDELSMRLPHIKNVVKEIVEQS